MTTTLYDADKVRRTLSLLVQPGQVFELRALEAKLGTQWKTGIVSGYFDDHEAAVKSLSLISTAKSIYVTLNVVNPDLLARRYRRLDYAATGTTTGDQHIQSRLWLLIDLDPTRPSGISATDAEKNQAEMVALSIQDYLSAQGWALPIVCDSGNGWHLLYRLDLPANDNSLIESFLKGLACKFNNGSVEVDTTTGNASRITKLYGTLACKGDNIPARPWRMSALSVVPEPLGVIRKEQLEAVAKELTPANKSVKSVPKVAEPNATARRNGKFNLQDFLGRHSIGVKETKPNGNATMYVLDTCPFNPDHGSHGEVAVFEETSGRLGFKCHHNSCGGKHWQEFRLHFETDAYDKRQVAAGYRFDQVGDTTTAIAPAGGLTNDQIAATEKDAPADADALQNAIQDKRPKLRLPGPNRLLSDFATELAGIVGGRLFTRNGEIVVLSNGQLKPMTAPEFRTWAETFICGYKVKSAGGDVVEFNVTMTHDDASGVLASPQFRDMLSPVLQVNDCRLPVIRTNGTLELLPEGYDAESKTLTLPAVDYQTDMTTAKAKEVMDDLFSEFTFADADTGRSKAVAIAGMVGLYGKHLLPRLTLRPSFIVVANAEGAGKSLLAAVCTTPTLGTMPAGCKSDDENEIAKQLVTTIREARPLVFIDNLKGHLSSAALEAFLSAPTFEGRKLGVNEYISGENLATVVITGNGLTVSPDMRRRSLFVELHLEVERAEDKKFKRPLDMPTLLAMRPRILAALWALVQAWDKVGRPQPSRSHSAFVSWANVIGGIVEAAGFCCPLATATVAVAADPDGDDMRRLVTAMENERKYAFGELVALAKSLDCFTSILGDNELDRRDKRRLAGLFQRYDRRLVAGKRFVFDGKGHARRYGVRLAQPASDPDKPKDDDVHDNMISMMPSPELKNPLPGDDRNIMQVMQSCSVESPEPVQPVEAADDTLFNERKQSVPGAESVPMPTSMTNGDCAEFPPLFGEQ